MDLVLRTDIKVNVCVDLRLLGLVDGISGAREATVGPTKQSSDQHGDGLRDSRHDGRKCHGLNYIIADDGIPSWLIVAELAIEDVTKAWAYFL